MRKNTKGTTAIAIFLLFLITIFHSCKRQDSLIKSEPINQFEAKAWLQKNGLAYKNETISIKGKLTGKLNWEKSSQYNWRGRDYIDIPYDFYGQPFIGGNTDLLTNSFNLVIRKMPIITMKQP
ncbi:hypothetical protein [Niabella hibiscisoli]|uniref:hypothetical protein n=1 Tax=Niabella hibiscisoli TaxID=1825928 RepID=UPI001F0E59BB|nr:hypothetical protein [Niabella hibiscisoli]MCH5716759.1 hypothetical protein [Niabella hibiscisoli]